MEVLRELEEVKRRLENPIDLLKESAIFVCRACNPPCVLIINESRVVPPRRCPYGYDEKMAWESCENRGGEE